MAKKIRANTKRIQDITKVRKPVPVEERPGLDVKLLKAFHLENNDVIFYDEVEWGTISFIVPTSDRMYVVVRLGDPGIRENEDRLVSRFLEKDANVMVRVTHVIF